MTEFEKLISEISYQLLIEGQQPDPVNIREQLSDKSDEEFEDAAIAEGLELFWKSLSQTVQEWRTYPNIPDNLAVSMNKWWRMAMRQAHFSLDQERVAVKAQVNEADLKLETALFENEQLENNLQAILNENKHLADKIHELENIQQKQTMENQKVVTENTALLDKIQLMDTQISDLKQNHQQALDQIQAQAEMAEKEYLHKIDVLENQIEDINSIFSDQEREWKIKLHDNDGLKVQYNEAIQDLNDKTQQIDILENKIEDLNSIFTDKEREWKISLEDNISLIESMSKEMDQLKVKKSHQTDENTLQHLDEISTKIEHEFHDMLDKMAEQ